jgi:hypothetical protein
MLVRLKQEDTREGLVATISQRDDDGKTSGRPSIFSRRGQGRSKTKSESSGARLGVENIPGPRHDSQSHAANDPSCLIDQNRVDFNCVWNGRSEDR